MDQFTYQTLVKIVIRSDRSGPRSKPGEKAAADLYYWRQENEIYPVVGGGSSSWSGKTLYDTSYYTPEDAEKVIAWLKEQDTIEEGKL